jgi:hypothetical protein
VPAFAAIGGIDNNVMTARIMINHRNFIEREYQGESAMANEKGAEKARLDDPSAKLFLKLPLFRVVELIGATTPTRKLQ